jgi:hypothetical protein
MTSVRLGDFQCGLMLATAFLVSMWPAAGSAYTPEEEQACSGDAFRLCSSDIPDVDRVTACMVRQQSQLSPGCRVYFRSGPAPDETVAAGRPMTIKPAIARKPVSAKQRRKKPAKPAAT